MHFLMQVCEQKRGQTEWPARSAGCRGRLLIPYKGLLE